jgi:tRNA 2-thiouridine synthesizing protein E
MHPATDKEGFLIDPSTWSPATAEWLAAREGIALTEAHWTLIALIRAFYEAREVSPPMRVLVKLVRDQIGEECGNSLYLLKLFPGSPAKLLAKVAGLPRPSNCL